MVTMRCRGFCTNLFLIGAVALIGADLTYFPELPTFTVLHAAQSHPVMELRKRLLGADKLLPEHGVYSFLSENNDYPTLQLLHYVLSPRLFVTTLDRPLILAHITGDLDQQLVKHNLSVKHSLRNQWFILEGLKPPS